MGVKLSARENDDFLWLGETLRIPETQDVDFRLFMFPDGESVHVAIGPWPGDPRVHWVATLGTRKIFLMVSDGDTDLMGEFLSHVAAYDRTEEQVEYGHSLRIDHPFLESNGWTAVCFLDPQDLPGYPGPEVDNLSTKLLWTLPIDHAEYEAKTGHGLNEMFDCIEGSGRDVCRFQRFETTQTSQ